MQNGECSSSYVVRTASAERAPIPASFLFFSFSFSLFLPLTKMLVLAARCQEGQPAGGSQISRVVSCLANNGCEEGFGRAFDRVRAWACIEESVNGCFLLFFFISFNLLLGGVLQINAFTDPPAANAPFTCRKGGHASASTSASTFAFPSCSCCNCPS